MNRLDRNVRAEVYRQLVEGSDPVDSESIAGQLDLQVGDVTDSLNRLENEHRLALDGDMVRIANPFSGVPTDYTTVVEGRSWFANCAWDGLAILGLFGDGLVRREGTELIWEVRAGEVTPEGLIHLRVPAAKFWDDIVFT